MPLRILTPLNAARAKILPGGQRASLAVILAAAAVPILAAIGAAADHSAASSTRSAIAGIVEAAARAGVDASTLQPTVIAADGEREKAMTAIVMGEISAQLDRRPDLNGIVRGTTVTTRVADGAVMTEVCLKAETRTALLKLVGLMRLETETCARAKGPQHS